MSLFLIVNADDFGLTRGVNRAILACHLAGSVTSTTLMANMAAAEDAADIAREHPSLGVGLHFNLTIGRPITPSTRVPSLVDGDGQFLSRAELIKRALLRKVSSTELQTELQAQWRRLQALGVEPTHVDSHQHVHALPQVFQVVSLACADAGVPLRMTWRWPGVRGRKSLRRHIKEAVLQAATRRCAALKPGTVGVNDGLCSVFDLDQAPTALSESSYRDLLDVYSGGVVELMVHPAEVDNELAGHTQITDVSAMENRLLRSGFLREYAACRQGRLTSYADIAAVEGR